MKVRRDPLDDLFSFYIRTRAGWKCERCGRMPDRRGLHCHHFERRRKKSVRWDEDNGVSLCFGCHQYLDENRDEEKAFMIRKLGQQGVDMLKARTRAYGMPDRVLITIYLKQKIKELENDN